MLATLRKRFDRDDEGFTLIELMVVVLIIAILLAIAIPTFLGARERANDRAAQSSLRNAVTAAKTIYTDTQNYTTASDGALSAVEPSLTFAPAATASTTFKTVSVTGSTTAWAGAAMSKSGKCFYIVDSAAAGGGTKYGSTDTAASCTGTAASSATGADW